MYITAPSNSPFLHYSVTRNGVWTTTSYTNATIETCYTILTVDHNFVVSLLAHTFPHLLSLSLSLTLSLTYNRESVTLEEMVRKCRRIAEINAVMEMAQVGVSTRAPAALPMGAASSSARTKRRKINDNQQLKFSASSFVEINGRNQAVIQPETTLRPDARCTSPTTDEFPESCCSSNGSTGLREERIDFLDLEVTNFLLPHEQFHISIKYLSLSMLN